MNRTLFRRDRAVNVKDATVDHFPTVPSAIQIFRGTKVFRRAAKLYTILRREKAMFIRYGKDTRTILRRNG